MSRIKNNIVGIDLGTYNTVIAFYDEIARAGQCCVSLDGGNVTPSVIYFETKDNYVVGKDAKECALIYPKRTAYGFKILMGATKEAFTVDQKTFSPQELSALILKKVKADAEALLGIKVRDVIITVPAEFDLAARQATMEAGKMADMNVLQLIDEPTAAVCHLNTIVNLTGKRVMIGDFGGGTFDLVVAEITEDEVNEIAIRGDGHLGGMDWDQAFVDYIKSTYLKGQTLYIDDEQKLLLDVEDAKKKLSNKSRTKISVRTEKERMLLELTRDKFDACTKHLLKKIRKHLETLMEDLKEQGKQEMDKIILVGGAARMPQIQNLFKEMFPKTEVVAMDHDEAVAKGAAVYGKMLSENKKVRRTKQSFTLKKLNRISSYSYGLKAIMAGDGSKIISNMILKDGGLPAVVKRRFVTSRDDQEIVCLDIYKNDQKKEFVELGDGQLIGQCELELTGTLKKGSDIFVTFKLNEDGTLGVLGEEPESGQCCEGIFKI